MAVPAPSVRESYPHRDLGIVFVVIGLLLLVFAVVVGGYCQVVTSGGYCLYPYAVGGIVLGLIGFILFIAGLIYITIRTPTVNPAPPFFAPGWMPPPMFPPPPPPAPLLACKNCGRIFAVGQHLFCPNCGSKLGA